MSWSPAKRSVPGREGLNLRQGAPPDWWRSEPRVFRRFVAPHTLGRCNFEEWCVDPASARFYIRTEARSAGSAVAVRVPNPAIGLKLLKYGEQRGEAATLLLNGVERVSGICREIHGSLPFTQDWRFDDIVATRSLSGSGIGFHGGHEDGYVAQIQGTRRWRVWSKDRLSTEYRYFLMGRGDDEYAVLPDRPNAAPLLDITLEPGDLLYIPALFPHEGVSTTTSVSLSVAWRGFSLFTLLRRYAGADIYSRLLWLSDTHPEAAHTLLPDPAAGEDILRHITLAIENLYPLAGLGIDAGTLLQRMSRLLLECGKI
jgi:hypothetical protein